MDTLEFILNMPPWRWIILPILRFLKYLWQHEEFEKINYPDINRLQTPRGGSGVPDPFSQDIPYSPSPKERQPPQTPIQKRRPPRPPKPNTTRVY